MSKKLCPAELVKLRGMQAGMNYANYQAANIPGQPLNRLQRRRLAAVRSARNAELIAFKSGGI